MPPESRHKARKADLTGQVSVTRVLRRSDCAHIQSVILENSDTGDVQEVPDYSAIAVYYAEAIASERLPSNRLLVAAAKRYLNMREMAERQTHDFIYSPVHTTDFCLFGESLRHFEGGNWEVTQIDADGNPDPRIILEPFEIWIESNAQGFRRASDGRRYMNTVVEIIPRKNGKSLRGTRAALFDLCCSGVKGVQVTVAAKDAEQAKMTLFGDVQQMVNAMNDSDDDFRERFGLTVIKNEVRGPNGSIFPLTGLGEKLDGLNPSMAFFEEAHAGSPLVYKVVSSAFGARPGQQKRIISTAGQRPEGPAFELIQQAKMILEGGVENYGFFAAIWTLNPEDYQHPETKMIMWDKLLKDETLIKKCNPMYGVAVDEQIIRDMVNVGQQQSISDRGEIARTRFNIWTSAGAALIDPSAWAACYERKLELSMFEGQKCWIGVDLAQYHDMCAIGLVFEMPNDCLAVFCEFYLPEDSPTAINPEIVGYIDEWRDALHLHLTEGAMADHDLVRHHVEDFCELFDVQVIACDPEQAHLTAKKLWDGNKPVMVYNNNQRTMTAPTEDLLARITTKRVLHNGNPILAWNVQNVHGDRRDNGMILPRKDKKGSIRKIDGFIALCMANGCRLNPEDAKQTGSEEGVNTDPYLTRGIIGYEEMVGDHV